jgi:hypothetical protein
MAIRFKCPHCQKGLSAKETLAGKKVACAACKKAVVVPTPKVQPSSPGAVAEPSPSVVAHDPVHANGTNGTAPPIDAEAEALSALNDEPAKEEEPQEPQFIEFDCNFCGEKVTFNADMGGKQGPCPNPECRRIVKIPLPKKAEKKDWRKLDKKGPSAALVNLPEQLQDAWGTELKGRVSGKALEEAGATNKPPKPGIGVAGWVNRVMIGVGIVCAAGFAIWALSKLNVEKTTKDTFADFKKYLDTPKDPEEAKKFKPLPPLLQAEIHRVVGLMHLQDGKRQKALESFLGARSLLVAGAAAKIVPVDNDLFLLELALAQLQLGGAGDDILTKSRFNWKEEVLEEVQKTLKTIKSPDVRQMALRDVTTQLLEKGQNEVALSLAGAMVNQAAMESGSKRPAILAQQIALQYRLDQKDLEKQFKIPDPAKEAVADPVTRCGYAEGFARKGMFKEALDLASAKGVSRDRLEACLGVASILMDDPKTRSEAAPFLEAAFAAAKEPQKEVPPWLSLKLFQLGLRADMAEAAKELVPKMRPEYKQRSQLETFLARSDKAAGPLSPDDFSELEATDKEGITLALAWRALTQHNARVAGRSVADAKEAVEGRQVVLSPEQMERARPMAHAGAVLGTVEKRR